MSAEKLMILRVLWGALLASTFVYLFVVYVVAQDPERQVSESSPLMPPAFALVAVGLAAASIAVPRTMAKQSLLQLKLEVHELPPEKRMFAEGKARSRYFAHPDRARSRALPVLQTAFIIAMALAEAIALFGFVLLFLGFEWTIGLPFFAVCWILMLGRFPTPEKLDQQIEEAYDADLKAPDAAPER